ncbi:hypothetical protein HOD08_04230 [bacterium]|jgi:hypothetical protein|nr:hypothetical protein [bacterium]
MFLGEVIRRAVLLSVIFLVQSSFSFAEFWSENYESAVKGHDKKNEFVWEPKAKQPFSECIVSWNAKRPSKGKFVFSVSACVGDEWSPYGKLAEWGAKEQKSFFNQLKAGSAPIRVAHVRTVVDEGRMATDFRVKVEAEDGAKMSGLHKLFATTTNDGIVPPIPKEGDFSDLATSVVKWYPRQSQMELRDHPRFAKLCSPVSTWLLTQFHKFGKKVKDCIGFPHEDVTKFAEAVHDTGTLDIYGNWLFNVAEAHNVLGKKKNCRVTRLKDFGEMYNLIKKQKPVVVSIRGPIPGGITDYAGGHLLSVIGFSKEHQRVICIDPGFRPSKKTLHGYQLLDFLKAWRRSRHLTYLFS